MRFGSVCSGIEAASVAWEPLGWEAAWLAEIEPFPCAVLAHHHPGVPNHGDMTQLPWLISAGLVEAPDLFCGGTPCQAFSVAGLRKSLGDARGNLSLTFCEIANAIDKQRAATGLDASVVFWENVPGVLNTKDNAFGCFLAGLAGEDDPLVAPGGKWPNAGVVLGPQRAIAWRVLDAQYFGVAQRRRRVFVVASARDGFDPAAVLFEFDGVRRDTAPSREAGKAAPTIPSRSTAGGGLGTDFDCDGGLITMAHGQGGAEVSVGRSPTLTCNHEAPIVAFAIQGNMVGRHDNAGPGGSGVAAELCFTQTKTDVHCVAHSLRGEGFDASEDGTGRGTPLVPVPFDTTQITSAANYSNPALTKEVHASGNLNVMVAFQPGNIARGAGSQPNSEVFPTLKADHGDQSPCVASAMQVRRLTPTECERLQGFPDGYTQVPYRNKPAADGPRYKALGNSWAVPVVRWIGQRIANALK